MITQVSFTADEELKEKALSRAKEEGITLKALFIFCMKSFVDGGIKIGVLGQKEPEVEEIFFKNKELSSKAKKLENLLR